MKVLIVTHSFVPDLTPRAFRWGAISAHLASLGHEVHVLCSGQATEVEALSVTVHRVAGGVLGKHGPRPAASLATPAKGGTRIRAWGKDIARAVWRRVYWPDYSCGWVFPAAHMARQLQKRHGFDWVISTSHPFSGHLVCLLAGVAGSESQWLVDIGDPYSLQIDPAPYNRSIYQWLSTWVERRVLENADQVSVTTESTADLYRRHFRAVEGNISVIGPLLSLPEIAYVRPEADGVVRIVFVGTLYRHLRSPVPAMQHFEALARAYPEQRYELHFYGAVNDCGDILAEYAARMPGVVMVHGLVPRATVAEAMAAADALLNIGNHSTAQLGSKVIEYVAMGRPIINFVSIDDDASLNILRSHPSCLTLSGGEDTVSRGSLAASAAFLADPPNIPGDYVRRARDAYSPAHVTQQYLALMAKAQ